MPEAIAKVMDPISKSWTIDSLHDLFIGLLYEQDRRHIDNFDRLRESITAYDLRYEQRFLDQEKATKVAFDAYQKAVETAFNAQQTGLNAALLAQKEAVQTALVAAEKAVAAALLSSAQAVQKAETAAERRFDSVNEFRQTLSDQQRTLMPRPETEGLLKAQTDKIESNFKTLSDKILTNQDTIRALGETLNKVLVQKEAQHNGMTSGWSLAVGVVGFVGIVVTLILAFVRHA